MIHYYHISLTTSRAVNEPSTHHYPRSSLAMNLIPQIERSATPALCDLCVAFLLLGQFPCQMLKGRVSGKLRCFEAAMCHRVTWLAHLAVDAYAGGGKDKKGTRQLTCTEDSVRYVFLQVLIGSHAPRIFRINRWQVRDTKDDGRRNEERPWRCLSFRLEEMKVALSYHRILLLRNPRSAWLSCCHSIS